MRIFYGAALIIAGTLFLVFLRENLVRGLAVIGGATTELTQPAETPQAIVTLSFAIPIAAISIGIITLIRARPTPSNKHV